MNKITTTFFTLLCFVVTLMIPIFLGLHVSMMTHHGMDASDCIEHCIQSEAFSDSPRIISFSSVAEFIIGTLVLSIVLGYILPLVLLYIRPIADPPNLYRRIKNYNYSSLVGIVKLTT